MPLELIREVGGRLNFKGEPLRPLDGNDVREAARFFKRQGTTAPSPCAWSTPMPTTRTRSAYWKF